MRSAVRRIDPARYKRLLSRTMPVVIESEEEKLLKLLTRLVEDFEEEYYHPRDATPLEVLHHLMESRETKQTHLWEVFGSKGIASEVLNGKRGISKTHAKALAEYFHVPADLFI